MTKLMRLYDVDDEPAPARRRPPTGTDHVATADIGDGIGRVGLNAAGELVTVHFDPDRLRVVRADRLGDHLVAAITEAEQRVRRTRTAQTGR